MIAHLDMSDPNQQCPGNLHLITIPVRGCGRINDYSCDSAVFPSDGSSYSRVCVEESLLSRKGQLTHLALPFRLFRDFTWVRRCLC